MRVRSVVDREERTEEVERLAAASVPTREMTSAVISGSP
jgi:hypothetical protein